jgi:transcription elongation factor GreA
MEKRYLTKETLEKLKEELQEMKTKTAFRIAQEIHEAASFGDLSENAAYAAAKEEKALLDQKIAELEAIINNSEVISQSQRIDKVTIGTTVYLQTDSKTIKYTILDPIIADPQKGIISYESPIGQALLNHKKGDIIEIDTPKGRTQYKIVKIA